MKLSPRERRLVAVTLIIAAACALYFLALGPALSEAARLQAEIDSATKKLQQQQEEQQQLKAAQKDTKALLEKFGEMLTRNDEAAHSGYKIREVGQAASAEQVRVVNVQPIAPSVNEDWKRFPMQFNLEGDLIGITNLLIRLRHAAPRLDVERVNVRANSQEPDRLTVQMIVSSYAFPDEKEKKKPRSTRGR